MAVQYHRRETSMKREASRSWFTFHKLHFDSRTVTILERRYFGNITIGHKTLRGKRNLNRLPVGPLLPYKGLSGQSSCPTSPSIARECLGMGLNDAQDGLGG